MTWDGIERREEGRSKNGNLILEMHGNIKTLVAEFKAMNGSLRETKGKFDKHDDESDRFRARVNILWYGLFYTGWIALFIVGVLHVIYLINKG